MLLLLCRVVARPIDAMVVCSPLILHSRLSINLQTDDRPPAPFLPVSCHPSSPSPVMCLPATARRVSISKVSGGRARDTSPLELGGCWISGTDDQTPNDYTGCTVAVWLLTSPRLPLNTLHKRTMLAALACSHHPGHPA